MTITYPLTFPTTLAFNSLRITPRVAVGRNESPFTFQEQVYDWGGQVWELEGSLPLMSRAQAEEYNAFLIKLNGRKGTFLVPIHGAETPLGVATGTPLVKGASQSGQTLITDGWTPSTTNILKAGDWFTLGTGSGTRLYKNLSNVNSNGSGEATLDIFPALRSSPADNAALDISSPMGLFRLASNANPIEISEGNFYTFSIRAIEAL